MSEELVCDYEGCGKQDHLVEAVYPDGEVEGIYCAEHMPDCFCYSCGNFCAGMEEFDFAEARGGIKGMCWECTVALRAELGEDQYGNPIEDWEEEGWDDSPY